MLRTISVTICNRISSAAAVLLPNDRTSVRRALRVYLPAGRAPFLTHVIRIIMARPEIEGLAKVICTFRCRLSLDAPFTSLQRATVAGSKVRQRRRYLPSHHKEQNNHCGEFYHVRYIKGRYSHAIPFTRKRHFNIVETICMSKKRKHRNTWFRITAPGWGMSGYPNCYARADPNSCKAGSMMAFGRRRMISPDLHGAGAVMI